MALVAGKCPRCNTEIQIEGSGKTGFCMFCGSKIAVDQAVALYEKTRPREEKKQEEAAPQIIQEDAFEEAQTELLHGHFEQAGKLFGEILKTDQDNIQALWGAVLAKTRNLTPSAIRNPDDYAYTEASGLFAKGGAGVEKEWREGYWEAFCESCRLAVESVDPRVFLELEIYRWYPHSNTFLYPISRDFDIQPILDKELWAGWNKMLEVLPADGRELFRGQCEQCCRRIREYFQSGFANMAEIQNGDLSRLMGTWLLKLTTGAQKT
ncbi:MAG: hypothetical protein LBH95_00465, partial [Oscillospiraceae bacterium]|nr:hypothetical protein [Oscillospiraceae bacterium]